MPLCPMGSAIARIYVSMEGYVSRCGKKARRTLGHVDVTVTIPMAGGVDSLNVAAAAAVAFWALRMPR